MKCEIVVEPPSTPIAGTAFVMCALLAHEEQMRILRLPGRPNPGLDHLVSLYRSPDLHKRIALSLQIIDRFPGAAGSWGIHGGYSSGFVHHPPTQQWAR